MTKPVYLALCDSFFPDHPGGMGRVAWDCAKQFKAAGFDTHMACLSDRHDDFPSLREIGGVYVHMLRRPRFHSLNVLQAHLTLKTLGHFVGRVAASVAPHVVHAHSVFMGHAACSAIGQRAPLFFTVHSPFTHEQRLNWSQAGFQGWFKALVATRHLAKMEKDVLQSSAVVHCLSDYTRTLLTQDYGPGIETTIIPHWTDEAWRSCRPKPEARARARLPISGPVFLTVRQLRYRYGLDTAVTAARRVLEQLGGTLVVAGSGPDAAKLQLLAGQDSVGRRIFFTGRVSDEQLQLLYEAADYFLLPTRALECFGLIILEAYGHGLPILATNVGAIPELVGRVSPHLLIPPDAPIQMAGAMASLVRGSLPAPPTEDLVDFAHRTFGRERVFSRYLAVVERLLPRR